MGLGVEKCMEAHQSFLSSARRGGWVEGGWGVVRTAEERVVMEGRGGRRGRRGGRGGGGCSRGHGGRWCGGGLRGGGEVAARAVGVNKASVELGEAGHVQHP